VYETREIVNDEVVERGARRDAAATPHDANPGRGGGRNGDAQSASANVFELGKIGKHSSVVSRYRRALQARCSSPEFSTAKRKTPGVNSSAIG
jgi:hypothetical protein